MGIAMKTLLACIAVAVAVVCSSQAFASDAVFDCAHLVWKHGHYICDVGDAS